MEPWLLKRMDQFIQNPHRGIYPLLHRLELQALAAVTAAGFGCMPPVLLFSAPPAALRRYAVFTVRAAERAKRCGKLNEQKIYHCSYRAGSLIGRLARRYGGLRTELHHQQFVQMLYRTIGIHLEGNLPGAFSVKRCYFSRYYSPDVCRILSNMDNGLVCGIFEKGNLYFTQRITEGNTICSGCMTIKGREVSEWE